MIDTRTIFAMLAVCHSSVALYRALKAWRATGCARAAHMDACADWLSIAIPLWMAVYFMGVK